MTLPDRLHVVPEASKDSLRYKMHLALGHFIFTLWKSNLYDTPSCVEAMKDSLLFGSFAFFFHHLDLLRVLSCFGTFFVNINL
jgi:hypothetical protein